MSFLGTKSSEIIFEVQIHDHLLESFDLIGHKLMKYTLFFKNYFWILKSFQVLAACHFLKKSKILKILHIDMLNMEFLTKNRGHDIKVYNVISQFSIFRKKIDRPPKKVQNLAKCRKYLIFDIFFLFSNKFWSEKVVSHSFINSF